MNSLLDISGAVQNAISIGNLQETQRRNDLSEQHMGMEQERLQISNRNAAIQEKMLLQKELSDTYEISKDDRLQFMPEVRNKLLHKVAVMAGGPDIGIASVTHNMAIRDEYIQGLVSGDPDKARRGLQGLATSMPLDKLDNLMKATVGMEKTQEEIAKIRDWRAMNAGKVEALQNDNARVTVAKPLYIAASSIFRDDLRGTDSPQFKQLLNFAEQAPSDKLLSSTNPLIKDKSAFAHILDGNFAQRALKYDAEATRLATEVQAHQKMLTDADHGVPLPPNITKAELLAKIETNSVLLDAARSMQQWYEKPLDKERLAVAKSAYKTLEARRLDIENLEKKTAATTAQYRQDALTFRQSEAELKHGEKDALSQAQIQYYKLPVAQQTPQAAAKIAESVRESTGVPVQVDDIIKNPNKPLVENKTTVAMGRALSGKAAERIDRGANIAEQAVNKVNTINRMYDALETGKVNLGPGATVQQYLGQLAVKLGADGKTPEERVTNTRIIIQGLADMVLSNREKLEGQGQVSNYESQLAERAATPGEINQFTGPELKALLAVADRAARFEYGLHENRMKALRSDPDESIRNEAKFFEAPPLPPSRFSGKTESGKATPQKGKATPQSGKPAKPQEVPTVKSDADFNKLPSGAVFVGPDGKKRRKP